MRGWLIKFSKATPNPYFKERRFVNARPPFELIPHWAICEPFIREDIEEGDYLFFAPMRTFLLKGVLRVRVNATEKEARGILGEDWYVYHKREVCNHEGVPRKGNVIIGELPGSFWIDPGVDIRQFSFLPGTMFDMKRQANFVPKFDDEEQVSRLYDELAKRSHS